VAEEWALPIPPTRFIPADLVPFRSIFLILDSYSNTFYISLISLLLCYLSTITDFLIYKTIVFVLCYWTGGVGLHIVKLF